MNQSLNTLGVRDGQLRPCPDSPNCVCSQASGAPHAMAPISFAGTTAEAMAKLKKIIAGFPRAEIVAATDEYLHAEFTSAILRFVDDVEFYIDEENAVIHFRSASRVGYSDWGANRARMEKLTAAFQSS